MRPSSGQMLMSMAEVVALRSTCDRLNVGAVIVRDGRVISTGYNGNVSGQPHCRHAAETELRRDGNFFEEVPSTAPCTSAVHAEANAIVFAARHGVAVAGAELWTTHQPCLSCAKLIVNSGIRGVWFEHDYRLKEGLELLLASGIEVYRVVDYSATLVTR